MNAVEMRSLRSIYGTAIAGSIVKEKKYVIAVPEESHKCCFRWLAHLGHKKVIEEWQDI